MVEGGVEVPVEAGLAGTMLLFHVFCESLRAVEDFAAVGEETVGGTVTAADGIILANVGGYEMLDVHREMGYETILFVLPAVWTVELSTYLPNRPFLIDLVRWMRDVCRRRAPRRDRASTRRSTSREIDW